MITRMIPLQMERDHSRAVSSYYVALFDIFNQYLPNACVQYI